MKKRFDVIEAISLTITGIMIGIIIGLFLFYFGGYKMGQLDAVNGKLKYEYVIKSDTIFVKK